MVLGLGVDIVSMQRMQSTIENSGDVFLNKVFTSWERERSREHPRPLAYYAKVFAAKEAIFKLFGIGWESGVNLSDIEIRDGHFGEPIPCLQGRFLEILKSRGGTKVLLSLSYEDDYAVAVAIME